MKKTEFLKAVSEKSGCKKDVVEDVLNGMIAALKEELKEGAAETGIPGIGLIKVVQKKARTGVNPRTGEKIEIAAGKSLRFKFSKKFLG